MDDSAEPENGYGVGEGVPVAPSDGKDVGATARFRETLGRHPTAWRLIAAALVIPLGFLIGIVLLVTSGDQPTVAYWIAGILFFILPPALVATGIYLLTGAFRRRPSWVWRGLIALAIYLPPGAFLDVDSVVLIIWPSWLIVVVFCQMDWFCIGQL